MFNRIIIIFWVTIFPLGSANVSLQAQPLEAPTESKPKELKNLPDREEEFMDWGLGMFIHWGVDSQLGSVISHSMRKASDEYIDRFVNELPKTFNPTDYDPEQWAETGQAGWSQVHGFYDETPQRVLHVAY